MLPFLAFYTDSKICTHADEIRTSKSDFRPCFRGSLGNAFFKIHINFTLEKYTSCPQHENKLFLFNVIAKNPARVVVRKLVILQVHLREEISEASIQLTCILSSS